MNTETFSTPDLGIRDVNENGWDLMKAGKYEAALRSFREELADDSSPRVLNNMGTTYLCMGDAEAAKRHFDKALNVSDESGDHASAGVARWLMNEREDAIVMWQNGLKCEFQDAAGGIEFPLLLFYAAVREPGLCSLQDAKRLVRKATKHAWASNWPGPIGLYLLGKIDEERLRAEAVFEVDSVTKEQLAQTEFYFGVKTLTEGQKGKFREHMKGCAEAEHCEIINEVFLARHELSQFRPKRIR
ncbi:MAG: tetratricopeptide repeat protein [Gemmataceae bacterium]